MLHVCISSLVGSTATAFLSQALLLPPPPSSSFYKLSFLLRIKHRHHPHLSLLLLSFLSINMAQESSKLEQEEGSPCTTPEVPSLCSNNCGFFGSSATMNLCSSCYRDLILLKSKATSPTSACANPPPCSNKEALPCGDSKEKAQPLRCFACHKRVGMRGFKCRCGDIFCSLHRYSDKHTCSFDYKAAARASITKANPIVQAQKLEKI